VTTPILIVDDEVIAAESIAAQLRGLGYSDVRVALSAIDLLAEVQARMPGLVLMDVNLGTGGDGIALAEQLRAEHDIPVIFVTAYADRPTIARAKGAQPFGYLVKPVAARDLEVGVEIALHNHEMDRRLRASERALRQTTERLDLAMRATGVAIWEWVVPTGETSFDERWAEMIGYTLDELQPVSIDTWAQRCHPDDLARSDEELERCFRREKEFYDCECRIRHRDGHWVWILDLGKVVEWTPDGRPLRMVGAHIDVTHHKQRAEERLELERRLLRTQKNDSLGALSGGVAHRFNNLLTAVIGFAEFGLAQVGQQAPAAESLREILAAAHQGAQLSTLMLAYTGRQRNVISALDLAQLVAEMGPLLRAMLPSSVALDLDLPRGIALVNGDSEQVRQAVMNLVTNAHEALGGNRGAIRISSGRGDCTRADLDGFHAAEDAEPGTYGFIEVADSGHGMTPDIVARLFDPFFSTKFTGRGLGLAAVRGIVRSHHGAVELHTTPGEGTRIRVWIPVVPDAGHVP